MGKEMNAVVRKTRMEDIDVVMSIYEGARRRMREAGNMKQWVNGYPSRNIIEGDISLGNSYVVERAGRIVGVFTFIIGNDPTYDIIDGEWLNDHPYGTIHRIAGRADSKGIADNCLEFCKSKGIDIRVDTHKDNATMLGWIEKSGFTYCGVIICNDGTPRNAFQLINTQSF